MKTAFLTLWSIPRDLFVLKGIHNIQYICVCAVVHLGVFPYKMYVIVSKCTYDGRIYKIKKMQLFICLQYVLLPVYVTIPHTRVL